MRAYLDIETTFGGSISVIGIYRPDAGTFQLVGAGVNDVNLYRALEGATTICTFNGASFDLPYIRKRLLVDLRQDFQHCDLLHLCRRAGLRGGLKIVEQKIGIARSTVGMSGWDAPRLWQRFEVSHDLKALELLLRYNRDDVIHLPRLHAYLERSAEPDFHEGLLVWDS
jgi:uncharacterized protein